MATYVHDLLGYIPTTNFRVSIFGSARLQPDTESYQKAYQLAKQLGDKNIGIVTGGGPGIMEAANKGHAESAKDNSKSIGLTIQLPWEDNVNEHVDVQKHFPKFSDRRSRALQLGSNLAAESGDGTNICRLM